MDSEKISDVSFFFFQAQIFWFRPNAKSLNFDDSTEPAAGLFEGDLFADAPLERREHSMPSAMEDKDSDDDMDGGWVGGAPSTPPR